MKKTQLQIRKKIEELIDKLELDTFKVNLLNELRINYRLSSFEDEDYSQLGNTRFGGFPDLPKGIDYPSNKGGYYNFLCQINFSDFEDKLGKLPQKGILYVFDGLEDENDFVVLFAKSTDELEKKGPPKGLENLKYDYDENTYNGIKVRFELSHYFSGNTIWDVYDIDEKKYDKLIETELNYGSEILTDSMDGVQHAYMQIKGFDTLEYTVFTPYESQVQAIFKSIENNMENPRGYNKEYLIRKKEQLLKFDKEKEIHLANMYKVTCLIGLESLGKLGWMWSDAGYKYVYILDEDLEKGNFDNLFVKTWSS